MNEQNEVQWQVVTPVPIDAPEATYKHQKHGNPDHVYRYETADGQLWGFVATFTTSDGKKKTLPRHYGYYNGNLTWAWKGCGPDRPPYGAVHLEKRPDCPVLIVEGEKSVEAARALFPEFVVLTSMGGSANAKLTDWQILKDRSITIWPDNDPPGIIYAQAIVRLCHDKKICGIKIASLPTQLPQGWNLSQPIPEGMSLDTIREIIAQAPVASLSQIAETRLVEDLELNVPYPFTLTKTHVKATKKDAEGNTEDFALCTRLEVAAITRSTSKENWGRLLRFWDSDDNLHQWAMPMTLLAGEGAVYRERLLSSGLIIESGKSINHLLHKYILSCKPTKKIYCVDRVGWHGESFVLPDTAFGAEHYVLQHESGLDHAFRTQGSLADWQNAIGCYAVGNSLLMFCIASAFAAPLIELTGAESGGFHFRGPSSIGKTTALRVASSVCGGGRIKGYIRQWRTTANALESMCSLHCDMLLCLDEIGQADPLQISEIAYLIANGAGKVRANRSGHAKNAFEWRTLFLSTGEISLADKINEYRGIKSTAGQEVRVVDLPADSGMGLGLFEHIHEFATPKEFSEHLNRSSQAFYGSPIRSYLEILAQSDRHQTQQKISGFIDRFHNAISTSDVDGQIQRIAQRFALVAAAGELGIDFNILPWSSGSAIEASKKCFQRYLQSRGHLGSHEEKSLIAQIAYFFECHGQSRFQIIKGKHSRSNIRDRAGFIKTEGDTTWFIVLREVFKRELVVGFDPTWAAKFLLGKGWLLSNEPNRQTFKLSLPGYEKQERCYLFTSKFFEDNQPEIVNGIPGIDGKTQKNTNQSGTLDSSQLMPAPWDIDATL
jgi:putative DNA primase/helicase